jgi:hypothetical protein
VSDHNYCTRCRSAGSIEFGMCQVCLADYSHDEDYFGGRSRSMLTYYRRPPREVMNIGPTPHKADYSRPQR